MYDAIEDPHTNKNSTVLVNKLDLRSQAELDAFEAEISSARAEEPLPDGSMDFEHYKAIHYHPVSRCVSVGGTSSHDQDRKGRQSVLFSRKQAHKLFNDLRSAGYLRNLDAQTFADRAAHFLAELNAIHAFREGNARSQLTFFALLVDHAGYPLKIEKLNPEEMLAAMISSFDGDERRLADVIRSLIA
jgi:cell filamentation protein